MVCLTFMKAFISLERGFLLLSSFRWDICYLKRAAFEEQREGRNCYSILLSHWQREHSVLKYQRWMIMTEGDNEGIWCDTFTREIQQRQSTALTIHIIGQFTTRTLTFTKIMAATFKQKAALSSYENLKIARWFYS